MRAFLRGFAVGLLPNLSFLAKAPNACFFDNLGYPLLRSELGVEVEKFETIALMIIASVSVLLVLKPVRCQAQAEVAPDHYNETGIEPITLPGNAIPANLKSGHLGGSFTCPSWLNMRDLRLCRADTRCRFVRSANGTWSH